MTMSPMGCRFQMLLGHTFVFGDIGLDLYLSINWQTSHWEYHANEKEVTLLEVFRLQAGLERRHRRAYHSLVL